MTNPQKSLLFPLLLVFYEIGAYLSNDMYLPALPTIMSDLHISQELAQQTLTLWFLGSASIQLIVGPLSDRYGRRPILLWGGVIYIISTFVCAVTSDISLLLIARLIQGATVSVVIVAGYASIHELYDQAHAIRLLTTMNSITVLAPAFGPLVGSFLLKFMGWRWLFWIIMIWAIIATLLLARYMPESHPIEKRNPLNLRQIGKSYFAILSNWRFNMLTLSFCFTFCGFIAWLTAGPFIVTKEFNKTVLVFGILQTIVFAFYIGANQVVKKIMHQFKVTKLIWFGLVVTFIGGILAVILAIQYPHYLIGLIIGMTIYSLGSGFSFAPLNRLGIEASDEPMGVRIAMSSTYMTIFGVLGSILGSVFYSGSMISLGYVLFIVSLVAILLNAIN